MLFSNQTDDIQVLNAIKSNLFLLSQLLGETREDAVNTKKLASVLNDIAERFSHVVDNIKHLEN